MGIPTTEYLCAEKKEVKQFGNILSVGRIYVNPATGGCGGFTRTFDITKLYTVPGTWLPLCNFRVTINDFGGYKVTISSTGCSRITLSANCKYTDAQGKIKTNGFGTANTNCGNYLLTLNPTIPGSFSITPGGGKTPLGL